MLPGSFLLFWALSSFIESVATVTLTAYWLHPTGQQIAELFPEAFQRWLADPHSWHGVHAVATRLVQFPLMVLLAIPGGLAVGAGLCLWDAARQEALRATKEGNLPARLRLIPQLSGRGRLMHRNCRM